MITKRKLIYDLRERLKLHSDDNDISDEYISYLIDEYRATIFRQLFSDLRKVIPINYKQQIVIPMETKVYNSIYNNSQILISKVDIPKLISFNTLDNKVFLTSDLLDVIPFTFTSLERFPYAGNGRSYLRNQIYGTISEENKLICKSATDIHKYIDTLVLYAVFEVPEDAYKLSKDYSDTTDYWDLEYPIEAAHVPQLMDFLMKQFGYTLQLKEDKTNDGTDT